MKRREDILNAIRAVLSAETDDFAELVEIAGLDPEIHFTAANLRGVDFGDVDLSQFDLQGAITDGAIFGGSAQPQRRDTEPTHLEPQASITDIFRAISHDNTSQETKGGGAASSSHLVGHLENLLNAEARFVSRLRERAAEMSKVPADIESIKSALDNDKVVQIARFFFLLEAYACETPEAVEKLLISHNEKISSLLASGRFGQRSRRELKKALFNLRRVHTCVQTVKERQRAVFAKTEIASLLFEHMGRDTALRNLDLLVTAGLLFEQDSDPLMGSNRKLMFSDGFLEDAVSEYLSGLGVITM